MYDRMLDKHATPDETAIFEHLGSESSQRLAGMESRLRECYHLARDLKFPFGNEYGWGYKYSHKTSHLCYVFFEKNAFTVMLQVGDKQVGAVETVLPSLLPQTRELWKTRYPCGEKGGWIHYRVMSDNELEDVLKLLFIRKKPIRP